METGSPMFAGGQKSIRLGCGRRIDYIGMGDGPRIGGEGGWRRDEWEGPPRGAAL